MRHSSGIDAVKFASTHAQRSETHPSAIVLHGVTVLQKRRLLDTLKRLGAGLMSSALEHGGKISNKAFNLCSNAQVLYQSTATGSACL